MKEALMRPYLDGTALNQKIARIVAGVSGARDGLFGEVLTYKCTIRDVAKGHILAYLGEKGVSFPVNRRNGKQDPSNVSLPMVDDVVAYRALTLCFVFLICIGNPVRRGGRLVLQHKLQ